MLILEIVVATYAIIAAILLIGLVADRDTTPVFHRWRDLLLCVAVLVLVSALWPLAMVREVLLEMPDDESEIRP